MARAAWVLAAVAVLAVGTAGAAPAPGAELFDGSSLYVVRRGWHIDVGLPTAQLAATLKPSADELPAAKYIFFGFGDRRYLFAKHPHGPVLLAALWPGQALVLTTGVSGTPAEAFGATHVVRLRVSQAQSLAAQQFIRQALGDAAQRDRGEFPASVARGPYEGSLYFNSSQTYSAVHTCNTWVAEVLKSAGLPVRSRGVLFAGQLWRQATKLAAAE